MSEEVNSAVSKRVQAKASEKKANGAAKAGKKIAQKAKKRSAKKSIPEKKSKVGSADVDSSQAAKIEDSHASGGKVSNRRHMRGNGSSKSTQASSNHDPELLAKYAWKIYLAEISEEGVTITDNPAAKALAHRCFDLAAIFLDEKKRKS